MSTELNKIAEKLFDKIRSRFEDVSLGDQNAKSTQQPKDARFFNFNYIVDNVDCGNITISIIDERSLKIYFSKNISDKLDDHEKRSWQEFLMNLRLFAKRNLLNFEPRDITRGTLKHRDVHQLSKDDNTFSKDEVNLGEGWTGTKKSSYENKGPVKIIVRHTKPVEEGRRGARTRNIQSIFLETHAGERFKVPENNIKLARAMARHISEGGSMHDEFGQHILEVAQECAKLRPFKSSMVRRTFEDFETQQMVEAAFEYHGLLNNTLKRISGKKGYQYCKENFKADSVLMDDFDINELKERFVKRTYNDKLEDALPLVQKAYIMKKQNKFADQFENWANSVVGEGVLDNPSKINDLKELMLEPLTVGVDAINAINALEGLIEDDGLFDDLMVLSEQDPEADARDEILGWLQSNEYSTYEQIIKDINIDDNEVDEAKGDIRKALAGAALAGGMALGGQAMDKMDQAEYANSPQIQKLEQLHAQALKLGNSAKARDLQQRIAAHKDRLSLGKGDVQDTSGHTKEIYRESVADILKLAGIK
jgi:hypothetical protein